MFSAPKIIKMLTSQLRAGDFGWLLCLLIIYVKLSSSLSENYVLGIQKSALTGQFIRCNFSINCQHKCLSRYCAFLYILLPRRQSFSYLIQSNSSLVFLDFFLQFFFRCCFIYFQSIFEPGCSGCVVSSVGSQQQGPVFEFSLGAVCIFTLYMFWFSPGNLASSHSPSG